MASKWRFAVGAGLIVLAIGKTWWDSRLSFASGLIYLIVLNAAYLLLRGRQRDVLNRG